jgi:hypothetical protein
MDMLQPQVHMYTLVTTSDNFSPECLGTRPPTVYTYKHKMDTLDEGLHMPSLTGLCEFNSLM